MSDHDPFDFPCDVPVKVFGKNAEGFRKSAHSIVRTHFEDLDDEHIRERLSREGAFVSITFTIWIETRQQLEAIYRDLHTSNEVLMVL